MGEEGNPTEQSLFAIAKHSTKRPRSDHHHSRSSEREKQEQLPPSRNEHVLSRSKRSLDVKDNGSGAQSGRQCRGGVYSAASGAPLGRENRELERVVSADISRGRERVPISCVNAHTNDDLPREFRYMKYSVPFDRARKYAPGCLSRLVDQDQCRCKGNCVDRKFECRCSRITRGAFAYNREGQLSQEFLQRELDRMKNPQFVFCSGNCPTQRRLINAGPGRGNQRRVPACKGHEAKTFVKECSVKCACPLTCGNRVVQRGVTARLQVFWTPTGKGWGLRCLDALPPGAFVCEYVGEIVTGEEMDERNRERKDAPHTYPVDLNADYLVEEQATDDTGLCLDASRMGNVARFINHRCEDATMLYVPVEVEGPDHNHYRVAFFTTRHVAAREELTWDYGIQFGDDSHPIKAFVCTCGSAYCRQW